MLKPVISHNFNEPFILGNKNIFWGEIQLRNLAMNMCDFVQWQFRPMGDSPMFDDKREVYFFGHEFTIFTSSGPEKTKYASSSWGDADEFIWDHSGSIPGEHMAEEPGRPKKSRGWRKIIFPLLKCHFLGGIQHFQANSRGHLDLGCLLYQTQAPNFGNVNILSSPIKEVQMCLCVWSTKTSSGATPWPSIWINYIHQFIVIEKTNECTKTSRVSASAEVIDIWRFPEIGAPPNHPF